MLVFLHEEQNKRSLGVDEPDLPVEDAAGRPGTAPRRPAAGSPRRPAQLTRLCPAHTNAGGKPRRPRSLAPSTQPSLPTNLHPRPMRRPLPPDHQLLLGQPAGGRASGRGRVRRLYATPRCLPYLGLRPRTPIRRTLQFTLRNGAHPRIGRSKGFGFVEMPSDEVFNPPTPAGCRRRTRGHSPMVEDIAEFWGRHFLGREWRKRLAG